MQCKTVSVLIIMLGAILGVPAARAGTALTDPSIAYNPKDGVIKLYGAGGPHTAFKKVADVFQKATGLKVDIIAGPEVKWSKDAQRDADILWGTSEQSMTAFLQTYTAFASEEVHPIYVRPAIIAVRKGNPKNIRGFDDLLNAGMRIVVTEGAGVSNTSGTGVWEDIAGRLGRLDDIRNFRKNIVAFEHGSGASYNAFTDKDADAWITWPNWPITHADKADMVEFEPERRIWRDVNVVISAKADAGAKQFVEFLESPEAAAIMATEGWQK